MWNSILLLSLLLMLIPYSSLHLYNRGYSLRTYNDLDALDKLKTVKRRVSFRRKPQREELLCRGYRSHCIPWTSDPGDACCTDANLVCRCNLWMQNCRCVTRTWG